MSSVFDEAYTSRTAPWVIGEPQPAIVALERSGWIRGAFGDGWVLEDLRASRYRGVIIGSTHAALLGRPVGDLVDLPAWLARARRL
ncbi:MAG: hypothetical protein ACRDQU_09325 [Pseudonocardiaceae bacterium]